MSTQRPRSEGGAASTVTAVLVPRYGGPEVLELGEIPGPELLDGTVLVSVSAAAVNNTDLLLRAGAQSQFLKRVDPPYVPGMDLAGVVLESADDRWSSGDRVMGAVSAWRPEGGGQAAIVRVPATSLAAVPNQLSDVEAATLPMNGLTAMAGVNGLEVSAGGWIAVLGAAGAVGGLAIQLAVAAGLRVVADAAASDEELVRSLGADVVVPRGEGSLAAVMEAVPTGVDGLIDAAVVGNAGVRMIRDGGRIATLRAVPDLVLERGVTEVKVFVPQHLHDGAALGELSRLAGAQLVRARVAEVFAADRAADAHRLLAAGGLRGRPVLDMRSIL